MDNKFNNKDSAPGKKATRFACLIAAIIGGTIGWLIIQQLFDFLGDDISLDIYIKLGIIAFSALFFAVMFWLSTPSLLRWLYQTGSKIEHRLSGYTSKEITSGTIGLVIGLLISFLLTSLIQLIPIYSLSTLLIILSYLVFSIVGVRLGIKYIGEIIIVNKTTKGDNSSMLQESFKILDSSVIIDGRILDLVRTGFLEGPFMIPVFVINQLKSVAENPDILKRNRGRRGLDIITSLQNEDNIKVVISETDYADIVEIDTKILKLAEQYKANIITNDYNLNKLASVVKVNVLNINELSNAIKPVALPGESMAVNIVKPGKEHGQGIGFLDDGTMIVVENGGDFVGKTVQATVTTSLQTNAGRMIFTRIM